MKIAEEVRTAYSRQSALAKLLKLEVDQEVVNRKRTTWHYESRIKGEESFALKVEVGRVPDPGEVEDVFACVLVVPNFRDVAEAEALVLSLYDLDERRPPSATVTRKSPSDFRFDDLRLYVRYREVEHKEPSGLAGLLFEVQVRTFLQHAWTIATHDLLYKAADLNWRRDRIAHQTKAALEQAEITIDRMASLEVTAALPETDEDYARDNEVIALLHQHWPDDQLPEDVRRLAQAVAKLFRLIRLDVGTIGNLLDTGRAKYGGSHNLDWSPYQAILQYLAEQHPAKLKKFLTTSGTQRLFVYPTVFEELKLDPSTAKSATFLG